jgi:protein PhnA
MMGAEHGQEDCNMSNLPNCPKCNSAYVYEDRDHLVCPECFHEWNPEAAGEAVDEAAVKDAHGTVLSDGDDVIVIKDLKVKGSSTVLKQGTKVKNIRLIEGDHDIDCRIDGFGAMQLKSEFVKKA